MNVKLQKWDAVVAIYILTAFIMLIVPLPAWILDILLAINISIALTVLFATMFSKEVLDMSFFPTMLLFTTIFRIALNTSSTRLILRDGNAGNVVETFGEFVGGGDLVIFVIIFIFASITVIRRNYPYAPFLIDLIAFDKRDILIIIGTYAGTFALKFPVCGKGSQGRYQKGKQYPVHSSSDGDYGACFKNDR